MAGASVDGGGRWRVEHQRPHIYGKRHTCRNSLEDSCQSEWLMPLFCLKQGWNTRLRKKKWKVKGQPSVGSTPPLPQTPRSSLCQAAAGRPGSVPGLSTFLWVSLPASPCLPPPAPSVPRELQRI